MNKFSKKSAFEKEWDRLQKQEETFYKKQVEKKTSFINSKLETKVPEKLQEKLDLAFYKAFNMIFEKGTPIIEKTYKKENLEHEHQVNAYAAQLRENKKTLQAFQKKANAIGNRNLLICGAEGVGLGLFGIGLPDIPIFAGMILKSIYEISLSYGYSYETNAERYFILLLIKNALSYGEELEDSEKEINNLIDAGALPEYDNLAKQIEETSAVLSKELLYMKFLQGIPIVGVVGGVYDAVYLLQIVKYAKLKYKRRFLSDTRR